MEKYDSRSTTHGESNSQRREDVFEEKVNFEPACPLLFKQKDDYFTEHLTTLCTYAQSCLCERICMAECMCCVCVSVYICMCLNVFNVHK